MERKSPSPLLTILKCAALAAVSAALVASAQVPPLLNYQGRVTTGANLFDGDGRFKFALVDAGTPGVGRQAAATADRVEKGFLIRITVTDGGYGYFTPPAVTITDTTGSGARATVTVSGGAVTSIRVDSAGSGYSATPMVTIGPPTPFTSYVTYWSNDNTSRDGSEPTAAVTVPVRQGLFSVNLGDLTLPNMTSPLTPAVFSPADVRLRIWFNDGVAGFQQLTPDQRITTAPYAFRASGVVDGAITTASLADGATSMSKLAPGAVTGDKIADGTITAPDLNAASFAGVFWNLNGNAGTGPANFLGTTDNQPLELRVNNQPRLRLETNGAFIAGLEFNSIAASSAAAVIDGGDGNIILEDAATAKIGGGTDNAIGPGGFAGVIGGGHGNLLERDARYGVIAGGYFSRIGPNAEVSAIGGGQQNAIESNSPSSTISGGAINRIQADAGGSAIGGGFYNSIQAKSVGAAIAGGAGNQVGTNVLFGTISGGSTNRIDAGARSVISGGGANTIASGGSTISGGVGNSIPNLGPYATIGGGNGNTAGGAISTIAGGGGNYISGAATHTTVGGGRLNRIEGFAGQSTIGGGNENSIQTGGLGSTIAGGVVNVARATYATIPGGFSNLVAGSYGLAAGRRAQALHDGAFVWADSQDEDFASTATNQFAVRASGGVRLETGGAGLTVDGQSLFAGGEVGPNTVSSASIINGAITAADVNAPSFATVFWKADGNAGTTPGTHFLGTTDNQPLELRVNNQRMLRLEPSGNVIGGFTGNTVAPGVGGVTIAGGGFDGAPNHVSAFNGTIGGGRGNTLLSGATESTIGGGSYNGIGQNAEFSTIGGGAENIIQTNASSSTIAGGDNNSILTGARGGSIGGGEGNTIDTLAHSSTISGGKSHWIGIFALYSTIGGGLENTIQTDSRNGTIGGGGANIIGFDTVSATIGGGEDNGIYGGGGGSSTIAGGYGNTVLRGSTASIGGGTGNVIEDVYGGTIPGGKDNRVFGSYGFAAGHRAKANHDGSLVWGDSIDADIASTTANSWTVRASGGTRFFSDSGASAGVQLAAGGNAWSALSDRNAKENFQPVDARAVLDKVSRLPVTEWNLKSQPAGVRHLGPMAQDFAAAFGLGEDDRHISTSDADGVALAAIQGLNQKLEEKLQQKETEITELKQSVAELKTLVTTLLRRASEQ